MIRDLDKLRKLVENGTIDLSEGDDETSIGHSCIKEMLDLIDKKDTELYKFKLKESLREDVIAKREYSIGYLNGLDDGRTLKEIEIDD